MLYLLDQDWEASSNEVRATDSLTEWRSQNIRLPGKSGRSISEQGVALCL